MEKKKVLFLHGALGAASTFTPLVQEAGEQYECICIDLPGHGSNTEEIEFSIENFTDWLIAYIKENFTEPVAVFGYSMGGYIALNAAQKEPELFHKVMTLATKFAWTETEGAQQIKMLDATKIAEKIPHYAAYLAGLHTAHDWKAVVGHTGSLIEKLAANPPFSKTQYALLQIPVCIGLGDHDNMVTFDETREIATACKQGNLYVIPGMQHPIEKMNTALVFATMKYFF